MCDITFEVGPEATVFKAHKVVLADCSPVFDTMFFGSLPETGDKIIIPDITPVGFKMLLGCLYEEAIHFNTEMEAFETWAAAEKYCIKNLKEACETFILNCTLSSSNIWCLLENALVIDQKSVVSKCKEYLEKNTDSCLRAEGFLQLSLDSISCFLEISNSDVSEMILLKSLITWGRCRVKEGKASTLRDSLQTVIGCIRFGTFNKSEIMALFAEAPDLLDAFESTSIIQHLVDPMDYPLPEWCCRITWPRSNFCESDMKIDKASIKLSKRQKINKSCCGSRRIAVRVRDAVHMDKNGNFSCCESSSEF
ncbi:reverse transcriptase [Caerostris extrusa]|uniref:Reverse transcriptase n=1 Tax=Caerostris extrusa TaxID=172846 RepID=A0AAV4PE76_CAEEX|nr:reverse transcriptase [Caerostris extrusa]